MEGSLFNKPKWLFLKIIKNYWKQIIQPNSYKIRVNWELIKCKLYWVM